MFGDGPKAIVAYDPYRQNTPLCAELELIQEFGRGDLEHWDNTPWATRRMWVYYRILQDEKKSRHDKRMEQELEVKRKIRDDLPKERHDRPGVRK